MSAVATSIHTPASRAIPYTDGSNFMGFPPAAAHFFPPSYIDRRGNTLSPFVIPPTQAGPIDISTTYSPYATASPFDKPTTVPQDQRDIANALLSLNSNSGSSTPQSSTPTSSTSVTTAKLNGFPNGEEQAPDLLHTSIFRGGFPHEATAIFPPGFGSCRQLEGRFASDVKPIISMSLPNISHIGDRGGDGPHSITSEMNGSVGDVTAKLFTSPGSGKARRPGKSGNNVCQICGKSYARPSTLKTHMRTHSGEKPYRCDVCGKAFTQAANLTAHLRTHSGEKPFSCPICQKRFSQSSSVTTHLRTHSGERPYRCDFCGKCFADTSTLTKHKRIHSGEKPYRCKICNLGFSQSGNLHRHMKTHTNQQSMNTTV